MNRLKQWFGIAGYACAVCLIAFFSYRWWAESTAHTRPGGVPGWYFIYPTQTSAQRAVFWMFYPCIRIDWLVHEASEGEGL